MPSPHYKSFGGKRYGQIYSDQQEIEKARKEYYAKKRNTWGELNPMTRTMPNGKGYNRKKMKQEDRRNGRLSHGDMDCSFLHFTIAILF